jgi:hypothetical protein
VVALCVLLAGCGGGAVVTAPDPIVPLELQPGLQIIQLTGFSISSDPLYPPCQPPGVPRAGTSVWTTANLSQEAGEWVARSPAGLGTLEVRLRATGETNAARKQVVVGTVRGGGVDSELKRDIRVSFEDDAGGAAAFEGEKLSPFSAFVGGRVTGTVRFSDSDGHISTCRAVQFAIQPY